MISSASNVLLTLGQRRLHPVAAGVISALRTRNASPTLTQVRAIDRFLRAEIAAGRWGVTTLHFNCFVWGNDSANALGWVTLGEGTFLGGYTNTGQVWTPNGTTGYFSTGRNPSAMGLTTASAHTGALLTAAGTGAGTRVISGSVNGLSQVLELQHSSTANTLAFSACSTTGGGQVAGTLTRASQRGILIGSRAGGNRMIYRRASGGFSTLINTAGANAGTIPTANLEYARSAFDGGVAYNNAPFAFAFAGMGMDATAATNFSANLAELYTALTGNVLPS